MKIMILKLLLGTNKLEESIFKSSIAIIYIVLLFIVFQNVLTSTYNWFNYVNTDACTYIHGRDGSYKQDVGEIYLKKII